MPNARHSCQTKFLISYYQVIENDNILPNFATSCFKNFATYNEWWRWIAVHETRIPFVCVHYTRRVARLPGVWLLLASGRLGHWCFWRQICCYAAHAWSFRGFLAFCIYINGYFNLCLAWYYIAYTYIIHDIYAVCITKHSISFIVKLSN